MEQHVERLSDTVFDEITLNPDWVNLMRGVQQLMNIRTPSTPLDPSRSSPIRDSPRSPSPISTNYDSDEGDDRIMETVYEISSDDDDDFEEGQRLTPHLENASTPLHANGDPTNPRRLSFDNSPGVDEIDNLHVNEEMNDNLSGVEEMDTTVPFDMANVESGNINIISDNVIEVGAEVAIESSPVRLQYILECPICFDDLIDKTPLLLKCRHVICSECLGRLNADALIAKKDIECSFCKVIIKENDFSVLYLPIKIAK